MKMYDYINRVVITVPLSVYEDPWARWWVRLVRWARPGVPEPPHIRPIFELDKGVPNRLMHQGPWLFRGLMVSIEEYDGKGKPDKVCGIMGHVLEECGDGIHGPDEIEYGEWMKATRHSLPSNQSFSRGSSNNWNNNSTQRGRDRARGGGHGTQQGDHAAAANVSMREGAAYVSKKRNSQEAGLQDDDDLHDTIESPAKDAANEGKEQKSSSVARKLDLTDEAPQKTVDPLAVLVDHIPTSVSGSNIQIPPPPPEYKTSRERKRLKNGEAPNKMANSTRASAGSHEERREAQ
uniref:DUF4283 domain-containing protein n=1 Tax=Aegilops tauschii TaxID=37682 RepID=N1R5A8_AEGTA